MRIAALVFMVFMVLMFLIATEVGAGESLVRDQVLDFHVM